MMTEWKELNNMGKYESSRTTVKSVYQRSNIHELTKLVATQGDSSLIERYKYWYHTTNRSSNGNPAWLKRIYWKYKLSSTMATQGVCEVI